VTSAEAPLFGADLREEEGGSVLALTGECDMSTVSQLSEALEEALRAGKPLLVDLSELTFLDSSCLRTLLQASEKAGPDAGLSLRRGPDEVMRVLEIAGVMDKLHFE
jgi:anti-sigma B factor antagonist